MPTTFTTGVSLGRALELATTVSYLAEQAYAAVAALEKCLASPYFDVDSVGLKDVRDAEQIERLTKEVGERRKDIDSMMFAEVLASAEHLYRATDQAVKHGMGSDDA